MRAHEVINSMCDEKNQGGSFSRAIRRVVINTPNFKPKTSIFFVTHRVLTNYPNSFLKLKLLLRISRGQISQMNSAYNRFFNQTMQR